MGEAICELSIFCRICPSNCGPITSVDARAKLFRLLPDRANARTRGYTCFRGVDDGRMRSSRHQIDSDDPPRTETARLADIQL